MAASTPVTTGTAVKTVTTIYENADEGRLVNLVTVITQATDGADAGKVSIDNQRTVVSGLDGQADATVIDEACLSVAAHWAAVKTAADAMFE